MLLVVGMTSPKFGEWRPIETAPKDGNAFLAYGQHDGPHPDAARGVQRGDHWWGIIQWDIWRDQPPSWTDKWVFAKDGKPTWSKPTRWMPLPPCPE
jgi:hypothetical protein